MKFKIAIPIYKTSVFIVVGESDSETVKYFKRNHLSEDCIKQMCFGNGDGVEARTLLTENRLCYIRFNENPSHETIAHELMHVSFDVLNKVGIQYSWESEESYTYLLGYLVGEFYKKKGSF